MNSNIRTRSEGGGNERGWAITCRVRTGAWVYLSRSWRTYAGWMVVLLSLGLGGKTGWCGCRLPYHLQG
jgi:hypothetical protein